jgi:hypothetical protein
MRYSSFLLAACLLKCSSLLAADVAADPSAVTRRLDEFPGATWQAAPSGGITEIVIPDGSRVTADDVALFAQFPGLTKLQILNCREFDDAMVAQLAGLEGLTSLAITNSGIGDPAVAMIAASFPDLVELDLSSNTNLTGASMKSIASLSKLERLALVQTRFNDLNFRRVSKLQALEAVDIRGNMEAGDMTLTVLGSLPHLRALKHRSSVVTDEGLAALAKSGTLDSLLAQDFAITNASGHHLASLIGLTSLEVFRCQGFGSEGVLALAPLKKLSRLTLRDLPEVGNDALAVLAELPGLRRLYLHELASVGDEGLAHLTQAGPLEVLDIWSLPRLTDGTAGVIAGLPHLRELSIRETGLTAASLEKLAAIPTLEALTFKNGAVPEATAVKVAGLKKWKKLDLGK